MSQDYQEKIAKLVSDAEAKAFARGIEAAIEALQHLHLTYEVSDDTPKPAKPAVPAAAGKTMSLVLDAVTNNPGQKGVEIVKWLENRGTPVQERTVRTCLRRLKLDRIIWQVDRRWYPRNKSGDTHSPDTELDMFSGGERAHSLQD